jgi:hypothetical protein
MLAVPVVAAVVAQVPVPQAAVVLSGNGREIYLAA